MNRKEYMKEYFKKYFQDNKERIILKKKLWYESNKDKNKERIKEYHREYYLQNKEKILKQTKEYQDLHKKECLNQARKYHQLNKQNISDRQRLHYQKIKKEKTLYVKNRRRTNINFKIRCQLSNRMWYALKGNPKLETTMELLGCSIENLKQHLESKFTPGMSWHNYGKWHVDHIIPCASFDLSKSSEQKKCFNWKNLQPLWAKENLSKGDKLPCQ